MELEVEVELDVEVLVVLVEVVVAGLGIYSTNNQRVEIWALLVFPVEILAPI